MGSKLITTLVFVFVANEMECYRRLSFDVINIENIEILHKNLGMPTETTYTCITTGFPILHHSQKQQVRKIEIYNQTIPILEVDTVGNFSRLEKISFSSNNITTIKTAAFAKLHSLKYANLSNNQIVSIEFDMFIDVPKLTHLHLDKNHLSHFEQAWLGYIPLLELLNLEENLLKTITTASFSNFPNLLYINLGRNQIQHIDEDAFYGMERLEILDVSYNKIKQLHDNLFVSVTGLHIVNLYHNELMYISDQTLDNLSHLFELITLFNPWQIGCYEKMEVWAKQKSVRLNKNKYFKCEKIADINSIPKGVVMESNETDCVANPTENLIEVLYSQIPDFECYFEYGKYLNL